MEAKIFKTDDELRVAFGWASVISDKGQVVTDLQGDQISAEELVKATSAFMEDVRTAKAMHKGNGIGEVIHSFPLVKDIATSLGIQTDREGWLVGVKVHDPKVWQRVKSGELRAFSIGARAARVPVEE